MRGRVFLTLICDRYRALNSKKRSVVFDGVKTATAEGKFPSQFFQSQSHSFQPLE